MIPSVLVVIPLYNHGATVRGVAEGCLQYHPDVLVVDDGSTDGGADTLAGLPVKVIRHDGNKGKGQAILTAAEEARRMGKTHFITIDADAQHLPSDLTHFFEAIQAEPRAIVLGAREWGENVPGSSKFGRKFSNFWLRVQTGIQVSDVQCGYRAYPVAVFDAIKTRETRYAFEVEVLVKAAWAGYPLRDLDIAVHYPPESERVSHFKALKDNIQISLLNTRLTTRALMPIPHKQYQEDKDGKVSAIHPLRSLRMLLKQDETPLTLAGSGAFGILMGAFPLLGVRSFLIVAILNFFRLSKITGLAASQFCIPPFVPALCIEAGYYMRNGEFLTDISLKTLGFQALDRLWEWALGSLVVGPALALVAGTFLYIAGLAIKKGLEREKADAVPQAK